MMHTFQDLLALIKPNDDALLLDMVQEDIEKCYYEYFRRYHTYEEHILPGLCLFEKTCGICEEPILVELAWWYHDVIYIPASPHSEVISADKAHFDCIQLGYGQEIATTVQKLVMATQHFKTAPVTPDEKFIHDLDLAILGSDPEEYKKYEKLIREEYSFVDDKAFAQGRLQVLDRFICNTPLLYEMKTTLFKTQYFQDHFEKKAIDNILREINNIKKQYPTPE